MRDEIEQHPDRLAYDACQMRDGAVGHQHQVELRHGRRHVGEIAQERRQIDDRRACKANW